MSSSPSLEPVQPHMESGTVPQHPPSSSAPLLITLPSMTGDALQALLTTLETSVAGRSVILASPDVGEESELGPRARLIPTGHAASSQEWVISSTDYEAAAQLAAERQASGVLLLNGDPSTLPPLAVRSMIEALAAGADLALPRYRNPPQEGLVNSALLHPICRALLGFEIHSPLPRDAGLSLRAITRLGAAARRLNTLSGGDTLLWPVGEAATAGLAIREVEGGPRPSPRPPETEFQTLFTSVIGSLFADVEAKAAYWQRSRSLPMPRNGIAPEQPLTSSDTIEQIRSMVEDFHNAFSNLRELWMLVLPPQSLVALKRLSVTPPADFAVPPNLWARTVYDFALAWRQRTLNRGHLLGALMPLYLAWVASFSRVGRNNDAAAEGLLRATGAAFEQEKPYFIARWRSPDRFNP